MGPQILAMPSQGSMESADTYACNRHFWNVLFTECLQCLCLDLWAGRIFSAVFIIALILAYVQLNVVR